MDLECSKSVYRCAMDWVFKSMFHLEEGVLYVLLSVNHVFYTLFCHKLLMLCFPCMLKFKEATLYRGKVSVLRYEYIHFIKQE